MVHATASRQSLHDSALRWILEASCLVWANNSPVQEPAGLLFKVLNHRQSSTYTTLLIMSLVLLLLALFTIAVSSYFLPRNATPREKTQNVEDAQDLEPKKAHGGEGAEISEPKQVKGGEGAETKIPVSVNYHFTRQCNYSCGP